MAVTFDRHRRLRTSAAMRNLVREHHVRLEDLIYPLFVVEGTGVKEEIPSMPGVYHFSLDQLQAELKEVAELGIQSVLVFGVPEHKDACGSEAYAENGIVQQAIRQIKETHPELVVIADTCLCQYTDHGHCGVLHEGDVVNDETLKLLAQTAVSQAKAGADIIAPSNMMDGFVGAIREALDEAGFVNVPIMSYAVKYASAYYGPFRDAAHSAPKSGDRKTYQMDPANAREGLREAAADVLQGADFLMVKPGLAYMDMVLRLRENFDLPIVVYNVSAEYSMVKAAAAQGWINEEQIVMETLVGFKRAGADLIITYHAKDVAKWLAR
ncbi:porphobilinogen synthase [Brevibacillus sp. H7]|jgi:porphobilinogen synthase|uniref:porphobilinogen synthase n=1 Tax=Brevibacillus sp. H7 TaxID=3349138 RepID=UPI0037F3D1C1